MLFSKDFSSKNRETENYVKNFFFMFQLSAFNGIFDKITQRFY